MSILGSGLDFPFRAQRGRLETAEHNESVEAAVRMLFSTRKGTRFMLPDYGSDIPTLLFQPCDENTAGLAELFAKEAIVEWIPRISQVRVRSEVDEENQQINLHIAYRLITDPTIRTMVYPIYTQEG